MLSRSAMIAALLGASLGVPYVMSKTNTDSTDGKSGAGASSWGPANSQPASSSPAASPVNSAYGNSAPSNGEVVVSLAEALRWDVNHAWVYARWPRATSGLGDPQRFGVRVSLITGTNVGDLAGSLTYYFGIDGRVEHISFRGRTGDTSQIVRLVVHRFGLQPSPSTLPGDQMFRLGQGNRLKSQLRTRTESGLRSASPHRNFLVELELERPDTIHFFDDPALRLPSSIAGIPVQPSQIQGGEPVPVDPIGALSKTADGQSDGKSAAESESSATSDPSSDAEQTTEAAPKVEVNLGIRRRMRWGT